MLFYAAVGAVGFLILIVMLVVGDVFGGDHDVAGHDAGDHGEAHGGPGIFSVRVMAAFLTAFGVGGVIGRFYGWSHPASSGLGVVTGGAMATLVYQFARVLFSQQASSEIRMTSLVGTTAEVSVTIPAGGVGQVMLTKGGERSEHLARSASGSAISRGTEVTVTALRGDGLVVAARSQEGGHGA